MTYAHLVEVRAAQAFTLADEYVPAAVAAIAVLRQQPTIGAGPVFVLGHSLGGTAAPRVAAAEPSVAGLVIMAGGTQPLHWAASGRCVTSPRWTPRPPPHPSPRSTS